MDLTTRYVRMHSHKSVYIISRSAFESTIEDKEFIKFDLIAINPRCKPLSGALIGNKNREKRLFNIYGNTFDFEYMVRYMAMHVFGTWKNVSISFTELRIMFVFLTDHPTDSVFRFTFYVMENIPEEMIDYV